MKGHPFGEDAPIYLQITSEKSSSLSIKPIQFLTIEEFAELCRVEERTVYGWLERAEKTGLRCYRPPGSRGILFEMNEAVEWMWFTKTINGVRYRRRIPTARTKAQAEEAERDYLQQIHDEAFGKLNLAPGRLKTGRRCRKSKR